MSTTFDDSHPFQARDGLYYETYQEMRDANVRANEERLKALGLHDTTWKFPRRLSTNNSNNNNRNNSLKRKKSSQVPEEPVRRSERKVIPRQVSPDPPSTITNNKVEERRGRPKKQKTAVRPVKHDDWKSPLLVELRQKFLNHAKADTMWFDQFKKYWKPLLSDQNYRTIMRQVSKLVSGTGIDYRNWPPNVVFHKDKKIDMSTDFDELYRLAHQYEVDYGKDLGHGWLVKIPLKKLQHFQRQYFEKLLGTKEQEKAAKEPRFELGTKFEKLFPGYGTYIGHIQSYNGTHYRVYYPDDGDAEDLTESELQTLKMLSPTPTPKSVEQGTAVAENTPRAAKGTNEPRFPLGTKFAKVFPGYGTFVGRIESFDGTYYKVFYPRDGDGEDLSESELSKLAILSSD